MTDQKRGRPGLSDEDRGRRQAMCRELAAEIKRNSGLSARALELELGYGSGTDGRAWRALASGSRALAPTTFARIRGQASRRGWLSADAGGLRYIGYGHSWDDSDASGGDHFDPNDEYEERWRSSTLDRALLILMAHARRCGVSQKQFFIDARAQLGRMESLLSGFDDVEIRSRAKRVVSDTAKRLLDGPEYPETSLVLEDADVDYSDPEA